MSAPWIRNGASTNSSAAGAWSEHVANDGRIYYRNSDTKTSSWEKPDVLKTADELARGQNGMPNDKADDWKEYETPEGKKYYHNHTTGITTWDRPDAMATEEGSRSEENVRKTSASNDDDLDKDLEEESRQELERLDRINVVGADGKAISAAQYALSDEAVPTFKTPELAEEAFYKMLRKTGVQTDWTYDQAMRAAIKDPVWRVLPSAMARKTAFEQYVVDLKKATIGKQKDRIEKLKQDFERMLRRHEEIKYYSQWQNVKSNLEGEVAYKAAIDEEERIAMFNMYLEKLEAEVQQAEKERTRAAIAQFSEMLQNMQIQPTTTWEMAQENFTANRKVSDEAYQSLLKIDQLLAFQQHVKELDRKRTHDLKVKKALVRQEQRLNRRTFDSLLKDLRASGAIHAGTKWKDVYDIVKDTSAYLNLVGQTGSTPMDLFWDICESMNQELRGKKHLVYDVLDAKHESVRVETTFSEIRALLQTDDRTSQIPEHDLRTIFEQLREKAVKRAEEDKKAEERRRRHKQDDLRSAMKKLQPPISIKDTYETARIRISMLAEFTALDSEEAREAAFNKYIRRLKERLEEDEERATRRERHSHRNSPPRDRRDHERRSSRDSRRRHRSDRHASVEHDPRSPKRTKIDHKSSSDRPTPVDETMLDYGDASVAGQEPPSSSSPTGIEHVPDVNGTSAFAKKKSENITFDDASEDGEIAE